MEFKQPDGSIKDVGRIVDLFKPFGNFSMLKKADFVENHILIFQFDQGMAISLMCSKRVADLILQHGILDIIKYLIVIRFVENNDWKLRISFKSEINGGKVENPNPEELDKYGIPCSRVFDVV